MRQTCDVCKVKLEKSKDGKNLICPKCHLVYKKKPLLSIFGSKNG